MSRESIEDEDELAAGRGGSGRHPVRRKKGNGQVGPFSGVRWVQGWPVLTGLRRDAVCVQDCGHCLAAGVACLKKIDKSHQTAYYMAIKDIMTI